MTLKKSAKWLAALALLCLIATFALAYTGREKYQSDEEIRAASDQLFEFGSVGFFTKDQDIELFQLVQNGMVLNPAQDCAYKEIYAKRVADKAWLLSRLDANIDYETDFGMENPNNCNGQGIAGYNDIHDLSARHNIENIDQNLSALPQASPLKKIELANDMNKDLLDLLTHFAPATHTIGVHDAVFEAKIVNPEIANDYQNMTEGFKAAQFAQVNSCAYWQGVDQAIESYVKLVRAVRDAQAEEMSPLSRALAGNWLSPQTIAPRVHLNAPLRPRPANCPTS